MGDFSLLALLMLLNLIPLAGANRPALPLIFEENRGQAGPDAKFVGRAAGIGMLLDESGATVLPAGAGSAVRISFLGGHAMPYGAGASGGESNYLLGQDSSQWRTHIKHWRSVRYTGLYPGIDVVFYGSGSNLEFDFAVSPGADPSSIRLRFDGAKRLSVSPAGDLVVEIPGTHFRLGKPLLYQPLPGGKRRVRGSFHLLSANVVAFRTGAYDRAHPLIIDPILLYTTYWGAVSSDAISGVATDSSGNIYVTGYTLSNSFTTTPGAYKRILNAGDSDAFVAKLNSTGTTILYSTFLGGPAADTARAIAVDSSGAAYITGSTIGFFPVTSGAFRQTLTDAPAIFAAKLDPAGATLVYATYLGGAGSGQGIAVDSGGNAWVAGFTYTPAFPVTLSFQPVYSGGTDGFLTRLDPAGAAITFSSFLGGRGEDQATAVAVDSAGNAYVTGYTSGQGYQVTGGSYQNSMAGATDAFVVKVSSSGGVFYSTYLGGTGADRANAIAIDSTGNSYIAGQTASPAFPTTVGAFQTTHAGGSWDGFVTKLNAAGNALTYSTLLGGPGTCVVQDPIRSQLCDGVFGIAVNGSGSAFLAGLAGAGFPLAAAPQSTAGGSGDAFAAQLNAAGSKLLYSTFVGGAGGDILVGAVLASGIPVMGGVTTSGNLPVTSGALRASNPGGYEGFLTRLGDCAVTLGTLTSFYPFSSGNYTLSISAASGCAWAATSIDSWITINTASGIGAGQATYTLAANPGLHRTGYISVGSLTLTLEQVIGSCVQLGNYGSWFPATGGSGYSVPVFATCAWTPTSNTSWVTINSGSGSGNGSVGFSVAANTTGVARFAQIDVKGIKYNVSQVAGPGSISCPYSLSRSQDSFDSSGGSSSLLVTTVSGCEWTVTNQTSWITITAGPAGSGDGIVGYTAAANPTGQPRVGQITIAGSPMTISQSN